MSSDNRTDYNESEQNLSEQRRRRVEQFKLNINEDDVNDNFDDNSADERSEINSYSGQDVKEKMARNSKQVLKKKKRAEKKERKNKNKRNRRTFRVIWIVSVVIVGAMLGAFVVTGLNDLLAINRTDDSAVQIKISKGDTVDDIADTLVTYGVIDESLYFKLFANITKAADEFSQGTYDVRKNMDYEAIISSLTSSAGRETVSVTITEGQNVLEIAATLEENGVISDTDEFLGLCDSDNFDEDFSFLAAIDNADERYYKLEGYLYPDTYQFYLDDAESAVYHMLNNYESKLYEDQTVSGYDDEVTIDEMVENSDYSLDEIMTVASIIQAEAADTEDMYYISSIIYNRLNASEDMGVSNLSLDSTKYYPYRSADDLPDGVSKDYTSNYDTYSSSGLPAGAICNPGMEAITAALNPYDTGYYYFCHDGNGTAYYASTIYEQNANLESIESNE